MINIFQDNKLFASLEKSEDIIPGFLMKYAVLKAEKKEIGKEYQVIDDNILVARIIIKSIGILFAMENNEIGIIMDNQGYYKCAYDISEDRILLELEEA